MMQIIFNDTSAAELATLPKMLQLDILQAFKTLPDDLKDIDPEKFGRLEREGRSLYRFRAIDYRIYFEKNPQGIVVHRVLHKNTLKDFLFRSKLPMAEDEVLQKDPAFWKLIDRSAEQKK